MILINFFFLGYLYTRNGELSPKQEPTWCLCGTSVKKFSIPHTVR